MLRACESTLSICKKRKTAEIALKSLLVFVFGTDRPTPDISWQKDGGELPSGRISFESFQKTLKISDVVETDSGDYRCTATNRLGTKHHIIKVTVKGMQL